ncbi:hypothetical protein CH372_19900 [Leptospira meyeri]|nr:hypothetical protein CH372_19900 [Leptospira meyeri]
MVMKTYIIIYNLYSPGQDYETIKSVIESLFSKSIHLTRSTFAVRSYRSAIEIRNLLEPFVDHNDMLLVIEVDPNNWATLNYPKDASGWIKQQGL